MLPPSHQHYADYLYWFHFANSNLQPIVLLLLQLSNVDITNPSFARTAARFEKVLEQMDARLLKNAWLAGEDLTAADIMTVFTLTTMLSFYPVDLTGYAHILAYLKRSTEREGYRKARAKADPELELMIDGKAPRQFRDKLTAEGKI